MKQEAETESAGCEVSFVVTGFGPFQDSLHNPTSAIADKLKDYLRERGEEERKIAASTKTMVIEVALETARQKMDDIYKELLGANADCSSKRRPVTIMLHLGVNYRGKDFQLESCAYNDASFRIPDQLGCQPINEPIVEGIEVGEPLTTHFEIPPLVNELNRSRPDHYAVKAVFSTDPGRFVCNSIYFYSMHKSRTSLRKPDVRCLFLHVPPNEVAGEIEQLCFVSDLMVALKRQVESEIAKKSDHVGVATPALRGTTACQDS